MRPSPQCFAQVRQQKRQDRRPQASRALASWDALKAVYHGQRNSHRLPVAADAHSRTRWHTRDEPARAMYRSQGIHCAGQRVYSLATEPSGWSDCATTPAAAGHIPLSTTRWTASFAEGARRVLLTESRKHPAHRLLLSVPGLGLIRVALLLALIQTPHRFRSKRQLWAYAGLALITRTSADYQLVQGSLQRNRKPNAIRGLNQNHNHDLKEIFKSAALRACRLPGPWRDWFTKRVEQGMKPELARLTMARKLAAVALILWKKGEHYNAEKLIMQAR